MFQYILCSGWSRTRGGRWRKWSEFQYILCSGWSELWVCVQPPICTVSIHPMFWLIKQDNIAKLKSRLVSIHPMFWLIVSPVEVVYDTTAGFNTSYVLVDLSSRPSACRLVPCFNTSYVLVDLYRLLSGICPILHVSIHPMFWLI